MNEESQCLQFLVSFEGEPEISIDLMVYAFDPQGKLLARAPVDAEKWQGELALTEEEARRARIFVAPSLEGRRDQAPTLETMQRLHAYEPVWTFDPQKRGHDLLPIPEAHWKVWLWRPCRVRGRVVRPVDVHGTIYEMPVCHALVHICEVDPFYLILRRLPDPLVIRLRDEVVRLIEKPLPHPWPDPDPTPLFRYDPGVIDPTPEKLASMQPAVLGAASRVMLNPQPEPPADLLREVMGKMLDLQAEPAARPILADLPPETKMALLSGSLGTVRRALLDNAVLLRPFLCFWPWLWPFLISEEIAAVQTDSQGRFDKTIWYCVADHPDLYFWVEYCIGGAWTTVYRPPVRCNTYWNYACGTEVTIRVTDPRVPWCGDLPSLPGKQVAVLLIGNRQNVSRIPQSGDNTGLAMDNWPYDPALGLGGPPGATPPGRPFGGSLEPHAWFGEYLRDNDYRYRWSYRRKDETTWHVMDRQVVRHYAVVGPPETPGGPSKLSFVPFPLGPDSNLLFKIPPKFPPEGAWAPQVDARENTASAFFLSHLLEGGDALAAAGLYELKLELFRWDGAAGKFVPVNMTVDGVELMVPPTDKPAPFGQEQVDMFPASEAFKLRDPLGTGPIVAFHMFLHVDNNCCQAEIYPVSLIDAVGNSVPVGDCGFIEYKGGEKVHITFKAFHPHDFASCDFATWRGNVGRVAIACAVGPVSNTPAINGFTRDTSGVFTKDVPEADLRAKCTHAAFAESLYVYAWATDGWDDALNYLDRSTAVKAFALAPAPTPTITASSL